MFPTRELDIIDEAEELTDAEDVDNERDEEVDDDFQQEIEYVEANTPEEKELIYLTHRLHEEFDTLGICTSSLKIRSKEDLYMSAVINGFNLVSNYRKMLVQLKDKEYLSARLKDDNIKLEKQTDALKQRLSEKDESIDSGNKKVTLKNMECEDLHKRISRLEQESSSLKKLLSFKESEWMHKIKHLEIENDDLRNIAERRVGTFTSRDLITANIIQKYKMNEDSYKSLIKKLHDNNQGLVKHLVNLTQNTEMATIS